MEVRSRAAWRRWLQKHHTRPDGIWLVTYKKHVADKYLAWPDIVREALCFGWIDSRTRRTWEETPAGVRKRGLYDIQVAKTASTRAKRIARIVARCAAGERPA